MHVHASAAEFLARHLASLDREVPSLLLRVGRQTDPEAIHDLRVAVRRLRTLLRLGRPIFGRFHTDLIRAVYTRVGRATGALRDEEVFLELLDKHGRGITAPLDAELEAFVGTRRVRERSLRGEVLQALETDAITEARTMLAALLALPVRPKRDRELARFGRRAVIRALSEVDAHRDAKSGEVEELHALRIAYKHLRYTLEFFGPVLPPDLTAAEEVAVRFQKRLGDLHDLDVALVTIAEATRARNDEGRVEAELAEALSQRFREARAKKFSAFEAEMHPRRPGAGALGGPGGGDGAAGH